MITTAIEELDDAITWPTEWGEPLRFTVTTYGLDGQIETTYKHDQIDRAKAHVKRELMMWHRKPEHEELDLSGHFANPSGVTEYTIESWRYDEWVE